MYNEIAEIGIYNGILYKIVHRKESNHFNHQIFDMEIPNFIKNAKSGDILATKYGDVFMVAKVDIAENGVRIYFYFRFDKEDGLQMNEWLYGFYGPKFNEKDVFYRPATEEEKTILLSQIKKAGFEIQEVYGELQPVRVNPENDSESNI